MDNMVFVGGVHGVGKTFFCKNMYDRYKIASYSASSLISQSNSKRFGTDKKVRNISGNQNILLDALVELDVGDDGFLLDGHFCLINEQGTITRVPESTFLNLQPRGIIVLVDSVENIIERVYARDGVGLEFAFVQNFQDEELSYSHEIATKLGVPYLVHEITDSWRKVDGFFLHIVDRRNNN